MSSLFSFLSYFGQSSSESSTPAPALSPGQQQNLMFEAVEKDDREAVERLLRERPSLANATTEKGESVLEVAMLKNRCAIAQLLIRSGANVNAKRADGTSPLELFITRRPPRGHTAVSENRCQTLNVLLEAGANVHHCTRQGATALHIAAERNLLPFAEALLKAGADVNKLDSFSQTPLATLLIYLGDNNRSYREAQSRTAFRPMIELLIKSGTDGALTSSRGSILHLVVCVNALEWIDMIAAVRGVDINLRNRDGYTAIRLASGSDSGAECVNKLLGLGADPNIDACLVGAAAQWRFDTFRLLVSHPRTDVNVTNAAGNTALHLLCRHDLTYCDMLVARGADIFARNKEGKQPERNERSWEWFAWVEAEQANRWLGVSEVTRVNSPKDSTCGFAELKLFLALESGDLDAANAVYIKHLPQQPYGQLLNVNSGAGSGIPMLLHFAWNGNLPAVHWLVTHGADLSVHIPSLTVLIAAVYSRNANLLSYLLHLRCFNPVFLNHQVQLGADHGSAITWASLLNDWRMTELLAQFGAPTPLYKPSKWHQRRLLFVGRLKDRESPLAGIPMDVIRLIDRLISTAPRPTIPYMEVAAKAMKRSLTPRVAEKSKWSGKS